MGGTHGTVKEKGWGARVKGRSGRGAAVNRAERAASWAARARQQAGAGEKEKGGGVRLGRQ